jgi:PTS system nitrogen regulatory IIA component
LRAIAQIAKKSPLLNDFSEEEIFQGLKEREALGSTGFGDGIAIPHCALENLSDFIVGIVSIPGGIDFDAIDEKPTKLFIFIIAPQEKRNEHIRILSSISSVLRFPENVQEILRAKDAAVIRETFLRHTKMEVVPEVKKEYQQFTVIIQHEDAFDDILTVFTEIGDGFVSVLEAKNARQYLYSLPLFSHFWNEEQKGFNRIIIAVIRKALSNEATRKINMIIERMEEESGVLLFSQDISYLNGSLTL